MIENGECSKGVHHLTHQFDVPPFIRIAFLDENKKTGGTYPMIRHALRYFYILVHLGCTSNFVKYSDQGRQVQHFVSFDR
jgi:hypothetical protein